jgi:hypothetical protein
MIGMLLVASDGSNIWRRLPEKPRRRPVETRTVTTAMMRTGSAITDVTTVVVKEGGAKVFFRK